MTAKLFVLATLAASSGLAQSHWVATWAAAQQQPAGPPASPASFRNQTVRMIVHTSALGGQNVRVQLSNAYGTAPLAVGAVHVALRAKEAEIVAGSDRAVTFSGAKSFRIPSGATMVSDAVDLTVPALSDLAVSVFVSEDSGPLTRHALGLHTTYISKEGNFAGSESIVDAVTVSSWFWLSEVDVMVPLSAATLVTFGDSITDGLRSTPEMSPELARCFVSPYDIE